jgi:hypothetical protein
MEIFRKVKENEEMPLRHKNTKKHKAFNINFLNFVKPLRLGDFVAAFHLWNEFN